LAHITGGGIGGNLNRILPDGLDARIDLRRIEVLPVFKAIRERGKVSDEDMLRTFNLGVGLVAVVDPSGAADIQRTLAAFGCPNCYPIGEIVAGRRDMTFAGSLRW
jgi:phosphoribosylformylglycinamidine cyclo-ligase